MTDWPPPTEDVAALVAAIGPEATLALVEAMGGTRVYVGRRDRGPSEALAAVIGEAAALKLADVQSHDLRVPLARTWRILVYRAQGSSYREIARRAGCTDSGVWRVLAREGAGIPRRHRGRRRAAPDPRQTNLLDLI